MCVKWGKVNSAFLMFEMEYVKVGYYHHNCLLYYVDDLSYELTLCPGCYNDINIWIMLFSYSDFLLYCTNMNYIMLHHYVQITITITITITNNLFRHMVQ